MILRLSSPWHQLKKMIANKKINYLPILIILGNLILLVFLGWLIFQTNNLSTQNASVENQLISLMKKKNEIISSKNDSTYLVDSLKVLNGYFILPDQKVLVIANLEKLAKQAGIDYVLNNAIDGQRVSLDMSVGGPFKNIYYFIRLLETNGYWVSFEKISLSKGAVAKSSHWVGSMVVSIPNADK